MVRCVLIVVVDLYAIRFDNSICDTQLYIILVKGTAITEDIGFKDEDILVVGGVIGTVIVTREHADCAVITQTLRVLRYAHV